MIAFAEGFRYFETVHPEEAKLRQVQIGEAAAVTSLRQKWGAVLDRLKIGTTELVYAQQEESLGGTEVNRPESQIAIQPTTQEWLQSSENAEAFLTRHQPNAGEWREHIIQLFEVSAATHGWGRQRERDERARKRERDLQRDKKR